MRSLNHPGKEWATCRRGRAAPVPFVPSSRAWNTAPASLRRSAACCHTSTPQSSGAPAADPAFSAGTSAPDASDAASLVGTAWDPEGIFNKSVPLNFAAGEQMGDLITRRERERAARRAAAAAVAPEAPQAPPPPLPPHARPLRSLPSSLSPSPVGLRPQELPLEVLSEVESLLARDFMPVDLRLPGVRLLHLDPPVLTVEDFLTAEQCDRMVQQAEASGRMQASRVGASNVSSLYGNAASSRRTSTSMMVTPGAAGPVMDSVVSELQARGKKLLKADASPAWGVQGRLPRAGQYCYEALQVARYDTGQHFLAHEDGFPAALAAANGFQRHATLLVYLNDVPRGGATRFDYLGLAVRPAKGKALLFFPAFADGTSDVRSLHTAEDAIDTKYATQQWIARGWQKPATKPPQAAAAVFPDNQVANAAAALQESELEQRERAGRSMKGGKGATKKGKGFGSKAGQ